MPDNVSFQTTTATPASGTIVAAAEVSYSGQTAQVQLTQPVHVAGSEGSRTVADLTGTSTPAAGAAGMTVRQPVVSTAHLITAGSGDATSVKASAGTLKSVHIFNRSGVPIYVKFHNTASAPTPGASVALTVACQAGWSRDFVLPEGGRAFATGIGMSVVTGIADNDSTGVSANDASVEVAYE